MNVCMVLYAVRISLRVRVTVSQNRALCFNTKKPEIVILYILDLVRQSYYLNSENKTASTQETQRSQILRNAVVILSGDL